MSLFSYTSLSSLPFFFCTIRRYCIVWAFGKRKALEILKQERSKAMRRGIWFLIQPQCLVLFLVLLIFLIFALSRSKLDCDWIIWPSCAENCWYAIISAGEKGKTTKGIKLHYKGAPFHHIISGFIIQGRNIVHYNGSGYESIYGGTFPDENLRIKNSHAGVVAMVNSGPNSNGSQFFITTVKASWLDGEHVVFGKVI